MSGKLDWIGAYNRPRTLGPITASSKPEDVSNANPKHLDKELKVLRAENLKLKKEYDELNATVKQLIQEASHEKFDERRLNLLKLQIIQLEKQVSVLNEALGCRHESMLEVENAMAWLADKLRSFISAEVKGPLVPIARADLMSLVEGSESARIKLFKAIEGSAKESVGKDLLFLNPFLGGKYKKGEDITLLDISLNRMNYLNFRHVAHLESKLSSLYKDLIRAFEQLELEASGSVNFRQCKSSESSRLKTTMLRTCITLKDAADDLLALSLLCPSSPWPALKRPLTKQVPVERVKSSLPSGLPSPKQEEIHHIIESSIGVCNHRHLLLEKEKAVLKEELNFHRATHDLQVQYTKSLFEAVRKGYGEFENSAKEIVVEPIRNLLEAYRELRDSASEQALRDFLVILKDNEEQLSNVKEMFEKQDYEKGDDGASAFSRFGSEFFSKLDALTEQCQKQRDQAIQSRKDVAEEQRRKDVELQQMIEDLELKYGKQWNPVRANVSTSENESILNKDKSESEQTIDNSSVKDTKLFRNDSRSSTTRDLKDDPTVLRSYLYSDNSAFSCNSPQIGACASPASFQTNDSTENADAPETFGKKEKKMVKKKKWRPDQEWVSDFSGLNKNSEVASTDTKDSDHKPESGGDRRSKVNDAMKPPSMKSENCSNLQREPSCDNDIRHADDAPKLSASKVKNSAWTYEPRLYVANRTLKLRRAGSHSGLKESDKVENQNQYGLKDKSDSSNPAAPETQPHSIKSQQKPASLQKRSSWR